jgi:hypothetical protein
MPKSRFMQGLEGTYPFAEERDPTPCRVFRQSSSPFTPSLRVPVFSMVTK